MIVNLNAEELKQVLEAHKKRRCAVCPLHKEEIMQLNRSCGTMIAENCLSLVKSYEDKIFALENRLKECENGYEGTLFLDRCKLHDAEEKVKELTQANEQLSESYNHLEKSKDELLSERSRLTEENERLKWENSHLECIGEVAVKNRDEYAQELHYLSNVEIPYLYEALEGKGKDADKLLDILSNALKKSKADTVRKMQERVKDEMSFGRYIQADQIDKIAKEMLEGDNENQ